MKQTFVSRYKHPLGPVYLDCNATTPLEPAVGEVVHRMFAEEIGNAGSRTHEYGLRAKRAVQAAREQVAVVVHAIQDEVVFTSGATESNNLAILGLAPHGEQSGKKHIISTAIEHKAVLEPLEALESRGFEVTLLKTDESGAVSPEAVRNALRPDTLLVSVMHVNNETGVCQPLKDIAAILEGHEAYFHVDAAQGFGKDLDGLRSPRIDLVSISSHKIHGPMGLGALIARRRGFNRPPLSPLTFGGGQERGLRPGTLPVPLIIGFGLAAEIAERDNASRREKCFQIREQALSAFSSLPITHHGDPERMLPHVLNFSVDGVDSEALMLALKEMAAVSNGSACTSQSYKPSHVLESMGLPEPNIQGAVRLSWCHLTPAVDWENIAKRIKTLI